MNEQQKPVKVWKRKNIHLVNEENDIKFRGPISYRYLRIAGWLFLIISQVGILLGLADRFNVIKLSDTLIGVLSSSNSLMTPLFLFAAFAQVLVAKDGYRRLLRTYVLGALGIYALFVIVFLHFGVGLLSALSGNWNAAYTTAEAVVAGLSTNGSIAFNIFIDLILCTLVTFFINYRPSKHFQGKKIYIFRSLVALPILYELGSITLKLFAANGAINLSPYVVPLLTTKPPVAFLIFIILALFVKNRERFYIKHGKTHEEYQAFLNTNVNRLHFSLFLVFTVIGAVIFDIVLAFFVCVFRLVPVAQVTPELVPDAFPLVFKSTYEMGFGQCSPMLLIIPLLIFFDYRKTHDNKIVDVIIPIAGIAIIILLYVEGLFELIKGYLADMARKAREASEEDSPDNPAMLIVNTIRNLIKK